MKSSYTSVAGVDNPCLNPSDRFDFLSTFVFMGIFYLLFIFTNLICFVYVFIYQFCPASPVWYVSF